MYFIKIGAKGLDYGAVIVKIDHRNDIHKRLREFCKHINCDLISIANLTSNVDAVVDDVGFLVSKNPVFEIKLKNPKTNSHTLAGTILIGETIMTCEGKDVVGFETYEKANDFLKQLDISLVGQTY